MNALENLRRLNPGQGRTLLGLGPMSKNCVDAAIEIANETNVPIILVASRRQIESKNLGGGYVHNWTTEDFVSYVRQHDKKNMILLARDHGGPWQNTEEVKKSLPLAEAMASAKNSFQVDIESGFDMVHIDPSLGLDSKPTVDEVLERTFELYDYCFEVAKENGKDILFEVGAEQVDERVQDPDELEYFVSRTIEFCDSKTLPRPTFIVAQTGTKVKETRNVGYFERDVGELGQRAPVQGVVELCNKLGIWMKEHNADYLSDQALEWHPRLGIHAANIAPEFGVIETKAFLRLLENHDLKDLRSEFLKLAYESGKWEKWLCEDTSATDLDKSMIAGHYVFSDPRFVQMKRQAQTAISAATHSEFDIDIELKNEVKKAIARYLTGFNLI